MGKTFRREKSYGPRMKRLNNHRDLPDYQEQDLDEEEEGYHYAKRLHTEERDNKSREDTTSPKDD